MTEKEVRARAREFAKAVRAKLKASAARRALPIGSSRARVTTANARLGVACEEFMRQHMEMVAGDLGAIAEAVERVEEAIARAVE